MTVRETPERGEPESPFHGKKRKGRRRHYQRNANAAPTPSSDSFVYTHCAQSRDNLIGRRGGHA